LDIQETNHIGGPYRTLTQDVSLYLVAITENTTNDSLKGTRKQNGGGEAEAKILDQNLSSRANRTLDAIRTRAWKEKWPLVTAKRRPQAHGFSNHMNIIIKLFGLGLQE
jgi:hypothetical protein